MLFQSLDNNKEQSIIKKIKYIYNDYGNEMQEDKFDNLVSRFFIKNILFFRTTRRLTLILLNQQIIGREQQH